MESLSQRNTKMTTQVNLQDFMLSEISQIKIDKYCTVSFLWESEKKNREPLSLSNRENREPNDDYPETRMWGERGRIELQKNKVEQWLPVGGEEKLGDGKLLFSGYIISLFLR